MKPKCLKCDLDFDHDGPCAGLIGQPIPDVADTMLCVDSDEALRRAFDAGWNATKYVICSASPEEQTRSLREQQEHAFAAFMGQP